MPSTAPEWLAAAVRELHRIGLQRGQAITLDVYADGVAYVHTRGSEGRRVELREDGQVVVVRDRDGLLGEVVR